MTGIAHQKYCVLQDGFEVLQNTYNLPWSLFTGVLGMPGRYQSYTNFQHMKIAKYYMFGMQARPRTWRGRSTPMLKRWAQTYTNHCPPYIDPSLCREKSFSSVVEQVRNQRNIQVLLSTIPLCAYRSSRIVGFTTYCNNTSTEPFS